MKTGRSRRDQILVAGVFLCAVLVAIGNARASSPVIRNASIASPRDHSGLSGTVVFELAVELSDEEPSAAVLAADLQIWDLGTRAMVPFDLSADPQNANVFDMKPQSPLASQHEYGLRLDPDSRITTSYTGFGGEFEQTGQDGELGRFFIGSRPRVWEIIFKGGRTLYLVFSEPVQASSLQDAVSLTNSATGEPIDGVQLPYGSEVAAEFTIELDGKQIDVGVDHELRILKTVVGRTGTALDGEFRQDGTAADFVLRLSPAQLDVFVNGYSRGEDLQLRCNSNMRWWSSKRGLPQPQAEQCAQVSPAVKEEDDAFGCELAGSTSTRPAMSWVLLVIVWVMCLRIFKTTRCDPLS